MMVNTPPIAWPRTNPDTGFHPGHCHFCTSLGAPEGMECIWQGHKVRTAHDEFPLTTEFSVPPVIFDRINTLPQSLQIKHYALLNQIPEIRMGDIPFQRYYLRKHLNEVLQELKDETPATKIKHLNSLQQLVFIESQEMGNYNEQAFSTVLLQYSELLQQEYDNQLAKAIAKQSIGTTCKNLFQRCCSTVKNAASHLSHYYHHCLPPYTQAGSVYKPEPVPAQPVQTADEVARVLHQTFLDDMLSKEYGMSEIEIDSFYNIIDLYDEDEQTIRLIAGAFRNFKSPRVASPRSITNFIRMYEWGCLSTDDLENLVNPQNQHQLTQLSYQLLMKANICDEYGRIQIA